MHLKRDNPKVIIVDTNTCRKGFSVDLEELLDLIEERSARFYHPADRNLVHPAGFPTGRSKLANMSDRSHWRTQNAQYQNLYLVFQSLRQKTRNHSQGKRFTGNH
jgi:hypothetical protein